MSELSILVVSPRLPGRLGKADSRTTFHMVRHFAERGAKVHLATFASRSEMDDEAIGELEELCASVDVVPLSAVKSALRVGIGLFTRTPMQVWYYRYKKMRERIDAIVQEHQPDVLYAHLIRTAPYLLNYEDRPRIVGLQISQTLNYRRLIRHTSQPLVKAFYSIEYLKVRRYEPYLIPRLDRVLLISPHDKGAIDGADRFDNIFFNPHGIEVDYYGEDLGLTRENNVIMMNGVLSVPTNVDAVLYFYNKIFPLVKERVPDAKLWLVGREPARAVRNLAADPSVTVTGFVEDLRPYLQRATVGIDPLRIGAGMQNKILVSMAAGLPVVATTVADEGIQAGKVGAMLVEDDPKFFADAVVRLLTNPGFRNELSRQGRRYVRNRWTWEYHFDRLESMIRDLIADGGGDAVAQYFPFSDVDGMSVAIPQTSA